jgi:hypothetical protein
VFVPTSSARLVRKSRQKVAIAVYSESGVTPDAAAMTVNYTREELELIYGKPKQVTVYTGCITRVGPGEISYDLNSFGGCSGAIVFLLDEGQPVSVKPVDYGKAGCLSDL